MWPLYELKFPRRICVCLLFCLCLHTEGVGQLPLNKGVLILSPRFFPGWQAQHVGFPFVIHDGPGQYKMYYAGSSSTQVNQSLWDQWVTGVVTSSDAINWRYPDDYEQVLFARKFMEGDVVNPDEQAGIFDAVYAIDAFVLKDGSVYKCWYTGWNGEIDHLGDGISDKINFRIGYATSPDGIHWNEIQGSGGAGSVLGLGGRGESDERGVEDPYIVKEGGVFKMWYVGYDGETRRIHLATSSDGVSWTKQGIIMEPGAKGEPDELGTRNPVVIRRSGQYELWYQGQSTSKPNYHVLRAVSRDGKAWKNTGEVVLHPEVPKPSWPWSDLSLNGDEEIIIGNIIVEPDNSCRIFYAKQFTAKRKATYAELTAPISYIFTERVNP